MRIGLISDIHEDIESLEQAFNLFNNLKIDKIVCLGDIVGFSAPFYQKYENTRNAKKCLSLVKEKCDTIILGNHELFALKQTPKYTILFDYKPNWYNNEKRIALSKNKIWDYSNDLPNNLDNSDKAILSEFKEFEVKEYDGINFFFSHFNYPDLSGSAIKYPAKAKHLKPHFQFIKEHKCNISMSGHAHYHGACIAYSSKLKIYSFGKYKIKNEACWISIPCVAKSERKSGIAVFDTNTFELELIQTG